MLARYNWVAGENPVIPGAVAPGAFSSFALMVRDGEEYAADGGWAYGAWAGLELTGSADADFDRACVTCHTGAVADNDYVFTRPGALPPRFTAP